MSNGNGHGSRRDMPPHPDSNPRPEVWGGVEATVNRVGDQYHDQILRSGHIHRIEDLDLFASLGIRALRYPVLWEHVAPNGLEAADWSWIDARLERLTHLGIRPIAGLLHHGSGPRETNLLDASFPERFADYALAVSRRYPWLEDYTPINEPLTTARFSALYGHWFPHERDDHSFAQAIINQCKATVLAMRAIRSVQPRARLIQTEDVGETHSTEHMAYQAAFENDRRWLSIDLISGRLGPGDPMWRWLEYAGIPAEEIQWFLDNPCPPDMVAINYYLTSERFLDERLELYPDVTPGTNGRDHYVDIAALHMLPQGIGGFRSVVTQAWDRYRLPMCIGEAHLGGSVEEQLRWLNDAWTQGQELLQAGIDVRAVTVWALLGSFDWASLVTQDDNYYEPGPFDIRAPKPRPTALAHMVRQLATNGRYDHPLLSLPGWWHRPERLRFLEHNADVAEPITGGDHGTSQTPRKLIVVGTDSPLRQALIDACHGRYIAVMPVDPVDMASTVQVIRSPETWSVLLTEAATVTASTGAEALSFTQDLAGTVAHHCSEQELPLAVFSSSLVFDGESPEPYVESRPVCPATSAGVTLARIEQAVSRLHPEALIIRTGHLFGPRSSEPTSGDLGALDLISPTYLPDLANAALDLVIDGESGIWHLANAGCVRWTDFQKHVAESPEDLQICSPEKSGDSKMHALSSERGWPMRPWEFAVDDFVQRDRQGTQSSAQVALGND